MPDQARGEEFDGRYFIWDHIFYHTISLKRDFNIDQQNVSEYFSYSSVVSGMLNIFEKIIGLRFSALKPNASPCPSRDPWQGRAGPRRRQGRAWQGPPKATGRAGKGGGRRRRGKGRARRSVSLVLRD
jgi:hypothetical protein